MMTLQTKWRGHYMEPAFWAFCSFASKEMIPQFVAETGEEYVPPRSAIEKMIDQQSGAELAAAQRFVDWCETKFGSPEDME